MLGLLSGLTVGLSTGLVLNKYSDIRQSRSLYEFFEKQKCKNTILPTYIADYVPHYVISFLETAKLYTQEFRIRLEQFFSLSCFKYGKYYHITHVIEGKLYKFIIKPVRGPSLIKITNEKGEDLSHLEPFILGHCSVANLTPELIHEEQITIVDILDIEKTTLKYDTIVV
jgi:hypothetical protein